MSEMTETVLIRPVVAEDLPGLEWDGEYAQYRFVFKQTFEQMQRGQRLMLIAVAGGTPVGQIFLQLLSQEKLYADGRTRGYLYSLRVRSGWQGQGIGTRLIRSAEDELRARGYRAAVIAAGKENDGALRLYQRLGYQVFTEDPGVWYFTDVSGQRQVVEEPCWVLEKSL